LCSLLHIAGDFLGRGPLLYHCSRNSRRNLGQPLDGCR
jgi:hypothetical protein